MFTHNRRSVSLNGTWKFNPDPYLRCRQQRWWLREGPDDAFFPCFNAEGLWDIQVPGTWKCQFEALKWYDGEANYVKDFDLAEIPPDHEAFLCFDGVVYSSSVYLNGEHVGDHDWGYSPFQFRVTDQLKNRNRLFVLVNNQIREDRVPGIRCDWNNDGGIINGVKLVFVPRVFIENFRTETRLEGDEAILRIGCRVSRVGDASGTLPVAFAIPELSVQVALDVPVGGEATAELRLPIARATRSGLQLWSPASPKLYRTTLTTPYETLEDEIGYREIKTHGRVILLNGEELRLYGVAVHSEFPGTGRTATPEGIEKMLAKARELGVNFLRCAHYPYADLFARAMDRAGMLWWEEVPVYWLGNVHKDPQLSMALGMLGETIRRDWNRASLIFWSISNECAGGGGGHKDSLDNTMADCNYPYWTKAAALVRELDGHSRLISSAECGHRITKRRTNWTPDAGDTFDDAIHGLDWFRAHPDEFYKLFDVLGGNLYVSRPGDNPTANRKFVEMLKPFNKPIMITEFGSMSTTDEKTDKPADICGHPKRHETILREAYRSFHDLPEIVGIVPWCLMDVRVPMHWRWYNRGSATFAYGLLDNDYNNKYVFSVVQEEITTLKRSREHRVNPPSTNTKPR